MRSENSVYQAELLAIKEITQWFKNSIYHSALLITDSLSSLKALQDYESTDGIIMRIQRLYQEICNTKHIFFTWVREHIGVEGNEKADTPRKMFC